MLNGKELAAARIAAAERFEAIAQAVADALVPGWTITYRRALTGRAYYSQRRLATPRPRTRKALQIFLHEVAHVVLEHDRNRRSRPAHRREYEAEAWSFAMMRAWGVPVPRASVERGRAYVGRKLRRAGARVDRQAAAFARGGR